MPNANATASFGTVLQVGDGKSPQTFHNIANITDIQGPKPSIAKVDTTVHSQGVPVRAYKPTLFEPGVMTFKWILDRSLVTHLETSDVSLPYLFRNRLIRAFRIVETDPSSTTRQFDAFVQDLGEAYELAGVTMRDVTIQLTTLPA